MSKTQKTLELEKNVLKMYKEGNTHKEIAKELGYDKAYISKILTSNGIYAKGRAKQTSRIVKKEEGPISNFHFQIGKFFHIYRMYSLKINIPEMAKKLKISDRKVRYLEAGRFDFTVEWLQKTLGSNFQEVMMNALSAKE